MAIQVMITPNAAFSQIRDQPHIYFYWSIGFYILGVILFVTSFFLVIYNFISSSYGDALYFALVGGNMLIVKLTNIFIVVFVYIIGRRLGGNKSWREVLSVVLYAQIFYIPAFIIFAAGTPLFSEMFSLQTIVLSIAMLAIIFVWGTILTIKGIKVVNGFSTPKAFGVMALSWLASVVIFSVIEVTVWPWPRP